MVTSQFILIAALAISFCLAGPLNMNELKSERLMTEKPKMLMTDKPEMLITEKPEMLITEKPEMLITEKPAKLVTEKPEMLMTEKPEMLMTDKPEMLITEKPEMLITEKPEMLITEKPEMLITEKPAKLVTEKPEMLMTDKPEMLMTDKPEMLITEKPEMLITEETLNITSIPLEAENISEIIRMKPEVLNLILEESLNLTKMLNETMPLYLSSEMNATSISYDPEQLIMEEALNRTRREITDIDAKRTIIDNKMWFDVNGTLIENLCEFSRQFTYFQPYPNDTSRYVLCDRWGKPVVKVCAEGLIWDQWNLKCNTIDLVKNTTVDWKLFENDQVVQKLDCHLPENACLNNGECKREFGLMRCVCPKEWTGDFCEIKVDTNSIYSMILSDKFSIENFREKVAVEYANETLKVEDLKQELDSLTYDALVKYWSIYKKGEIRFDRVINSLVEEILQDIYPDALYLSTFNASSENIVNIVRMIPNVLSFARYSNERYIEVFYQYQNVLDKLITILNSTWTNVTCEAKHYQTVTNLYMNQSIALWKQSEEPKNTLIRADNMQWSGEQVREKMRSEYNSTLDESIVLFRSLEDFQIKAVENLKKYPENYKLTLAQMQFPECIQTIDLFDNISRSSAQVWDTLVNYGFWYITNTFAQKF